MPLSAKITNTFRCDLKKPDGSPDCNVEFDYNPNPTPVEQWPPAVQIALMKVVQITHPLTVNGNQQTMTPPNPPRLYCCDEHAIEGIKRLQHLPALPPKIQPSATDADVKAAVAGDKAVRQMKSAAKPS